MITTPGRHQGKRPGRHQRADVAIGRPADGRALGETIASASAEGRREELAMANHIQGWMMPLLSYAASKAEGLPAMGVAGVLVGAIFTV